MYEDLEFSFTETKLMEWDYEPARKWAFEELTSCQIGNFDGYHHFNPWSMDDLRYVEVAARERAMKKCMGVLRSERFSSERMMRLQEMKTFIQDGFDLQDYRLFRYVSMLANDTSIGQDLASCRDVREAKRLTDEAILERTAEVREAIAKEILMHTGYLNLVYQLIKLGDEGDPDELIPTVAFYTGWPEAGTAVVAWDDKMPKMKVIGRMARDRSIDYYEAAVDPLSASVMERFCCVLASLDLPLVTERFWANSVLPLELVEFYLRRSELYKEHRRVLRINELDYVEKLLNEH